MKTDFLVHAARDPAVAEALLEHRARLRGADRRPARPGPRTHRAARRAGRRRRRRAAFVAAYDGVTTQLLLDRDVEPPGAWLEQLLTALLTGGGARR